MDYLLDKLIKIKKQQLRLNREMTLLESLINKSFKNKGKGKISVNANLLSDSAKYNIDKIKGLKINRKAVDNMQKYYANRYLSPSKYRGM